MLFVFVYSTSFVFMLLHYPYHHYIFAVLKNQSPSHSLEL